MWFDSWTGVGRIALTALVGYVAIILTLRLSGKRTLSKMSGYDLVVTVAVGSALATMIIDKNVPILEGIAAFVSLIVLQYVVTWITRRSPRLRHLVVPTPTLVYYAGELQRDALRRERLTEDEILRAIRERGISSLDRVQAVVFEPGGDLSVLEKGGDASALRDVPRTDEQVAARGWPTHGHAT